MSGIRRLTCAAAAVLALVSIVASSGSSRAQTAAATVDQAELAKPNPLGEMAIGPADAPVTIIQYSALTCHRCRTYTTFSFPEIRRGYVDTGKARYIFREAPLGIVDAAAFMVARCIAGNDPRKYFATIMNLFLEQEKWNVAKPLAPLMEIAAKGGLNEQDFNACMSNAAMFEKLKQESSHAVDTLGIKAENLPAIFINGEKHDYAVQPSVEAMGRQIDGIAKKK